MMNGCQLSMQALLDVDFVSQKLRAVIDLIGHLQSSEFPYEEPKIALTLLRDLYKTDLNRLSSIDQTVDERVKQQACAHANSRVSKYYPVLGFILRSTNVRNAFEIYNPLLSMCRTVYGSEAKLIMSSEWAFSPFTYPAVTDELPHLMFIGLPSTEASNSLIIPLAGHELGHSVWRKPTGRSVHLANLDKLLQQSLTNAYVAWWPEFQRLFNVNKPSSELLSDLFLRNIWTQSYRLASRQIEELFCDIIGLRLFGESFLYSFIYLIAPNIGDRAAHYPTLTSRVNVLLQASKTFSVDPPEAFSSYFTDPPKRTPASEKFVLDMADTASDALATDLIGAVEKHVASTNLTLPQSEERDRIVKHFCALSPASSVRSLGDIVNAGWKIRLDWSLWDEFNFDQPTKLEILNDLIFKSMEVAEFEKLTQ
jgi:hypothetical protein